MHAPTQEHIKSKLFNYSLEPKLLYLSYLGLKVTSLAMVGLNAFDCFEGVLSLFLCSALCRFSIGKRELVTRVIQ